MSVTLEYEEQRPKPPPALIEAKIENESTGRRGMAQRAYPESIYLAIDGGFYLKEDAVEWAKAVLVIAADMAPPSQRGTR